MPDFFRLSIRGNTEVKYALYKIPKHAQDLGVEYANKLLLEALNRYVAAAPYNYLSWAMAGGFFSQRQANFVHAMMASGAWTIPYPRTNKDHYMLKGSGKTQTVITQDVSMYYSMGSPGQTRMQQLRGWSDIATFLTGHNADLLEAFNQGVKEAISEIMSYTAP